MDNLAQIGTPNAVLVGTGEEFDPQLGFTYITKWQGSQAAIAGLKASFIAAGARTSSSNDGPVHELTVKTSAPADPARELPTDKWTFDTDFYPESIWGSAAVIEAAEAAAAETGGVSADDYIAYWRGLIKERIDAGPGAPAGSGLAEPVAEIYANILRGQEAYEVERAVVTRSRSYSMRFAGGLSLDAVPKIYTTDALIFYFGIPSAIAARLPDDPAYTPPYTAWAWKKRKQSTEYIMAMDKVQETSDWVFAPWATLTYDLITL